MSLAEFSNNQNYSSARSDIERTPPQDLVAEQSVLGGMLLSKDAIADVVEILRERDFYRPAHELIYDAILDLYGRGEPVDAITVAAELTKRGDIARAGGAPYLHTLISGVPTAANAGYYAKIVRERAIARRLVEAGTKIVQLGYSAEGEIDDAVDAAQAEVYQVTERRTSEDYVQLNVLLPQAFDEIEAISKGVAAEGVMTGIRDFDHLTNGLHPANMVVIAYFLQFGSDVLPVEKGHPLLGFLEVIAGITVTGIGSALYITCGLGPGPRDGLMTALHNRTGIRVSRIRLTIEITVLTLGFFLGGHVGLGTLIFALFIGQSIAVSIGVVARLTSQ